MKKLSIILAILVTVCLCVSAACASELNSIDECMLYAGCSHPLGSYELDGTLDACAVFYLFPNYVMAGPGGETLTLSKYVYSELATLDTSGLWGIYGNIVEYLHEHYAEIVADAFLLADGITQFKAVICIYSGDGTYTCTSVYDLINHTISTEITDGV